MAQYPTDKVVATAIVEASVNRNGQFIKKTHMIKMPELKLNADLEI